MRNFDFYEFAGIVAPGTMLLLAILLLFSGISLAGLAKDVSAGGLGLFAIVAYVTGHLLQAVGNIVERVYWHIRGGMPTDWLRTEKHILVSDQQREAVLAQAKKQLGLLLPADSDKAAHKKWYACVRQVYAAVSAQGRAARVDTFNGSYGLSRGIATALVIDSGLIIVSRPEAWPWALLCASGTCLAIYRMHRFGVHYARELFAQFLLLTPAAGPADALTPEQTVSGGSE